MSEAMTLHANFSVAQSTDLHDTALREIADLLKQLEQEATHSHLADAIREARMLAEPVRAKLAEQVRALKERVEWNTFTVALYGETNAGKSTIIETLRGLLGESTKVAQRKAFRDFQAQHGLTDAALSDLLTAVESARVQLDSANAQAAAATARLDAKLASLQHDVDRLLQAAAAKRAGAGFLLSLFYRFRPPAEHLAAQSGTKRLEEITARHGIERKRIASERDRAEKILREREAARHRTVAALEKLSNLADGQIVGNGRSDYTLEAHRYVFEVGHQRFELLDVPGIEGKETRVMESILGAVRTAHAVFYVTGKAAAPQTGDKPGQGTLEKIRLHLGDQSEVHTIYNKRITNPIALDKPEFMSQDERASLAVLDETMRTHLGGQYRGHLALSALPAFLATADCLVPGSDHQRSRDKFLAKSAAEELMSKCGFESFVNWLKRDMVADCGKRIRLANVNKIRVAVEHARDELSLQQQKELGPLVSRMRRNLSDFEAQIDKAVSKVTNTLQAEADDRIRKFETALRVRAYERIESGLNNEELKAMLHECIEEQQQDFEKNVGETSTATLERFQADVSDLLERFEQRAEELVASFRWQSLSGADDMKLNITIHRGVNYISLAATLVGVGMLALTPASWVVVAIGAVTAIISSAKALWALFDSDYKKSQQRKAANENIAAVVSRMRTATAQSLADVSKAIITRVDEISQHARLSVEHGELVDKAVIRCCANLGNLANSMHREGAA